MWSISNNGSSVESAQATSNSADLFVPSSSWALSGQQAAVQASGGATSNDSEPSPATTASPASQGRAGTVAPGVQQQLATQTAPQSQASAAASKLPVASTSAASGKVKRRKWTREERAEHSTIEKKRREDFNVSLLELARKLPSINNIKRVNKRVIVKAALDHVDTERKLVLDALPDIRALVQERDDCLKELNEWRRSAGQQDRPTAIDARGSIDNLSRVEQYAFNAFAGGFGGNEDDEMDAEQTTAVEPAAPKTMQRRLSSTSRTNSSQAVPTVEASTSSGPIPPSVIANFLQQQQQQQPQAQQQPGPSSALLFDDTLANLQSPAGNAASTAFAAFPQNSPTPADVAQLLSDSTIQDMAVRHLLNSPAFQEALRGSMNRYQPSQASPPFSFGQALSSFNTFAPQQPPVQTPFQPGSGVTPPQAFQQQPQQHNPHDGPFQNPLSPMSAFLYSYGPSPNNPSYPY